MTVSFGNHRYRSSGMGLLVVLVYCLFHTHGSRSFEIDTEPTGRRVLHSSSSSSHVYSKHPKSHSSSHLKADSSISSSSSSSSSHGSKSSKKSKGKAAKEKEKEKQESKYIYKENTKDMQIIEKNNVQIAQSFLAAINAMPSSGRGGENLRRNTYDTRDNDMRKVVLQQSKLLHSKWQEQLLVAVDNTATTANTTNTANTTTERTFEPLPPAPDDHHLIGFARKKDWFGSALCNETTKRDETIDNTTAAANEFYDVVDMLNVCWISSLRNPNASAAGAYVYTKASAKRKQYPMVPFKYLAIQRLLYGDDQCTPGNELDEELFKDQLLDLDRKYNQEYPEVCRKSHMPIDDPIHANTVHSRIGDVVDDHDPINDDINYNKEVILKAYSSPENCMARSGHAIISATLPNCIVGPNETTSRFVCNEDGGYDVFRYEGLDCDDEDMMNRESYTQEMFCQNVFPVDAVLAFASIQCSITPLASAVASKSAADVAAATVTVNKGGDDGMKGSFNISDKMRMYIRQPVDFKYFWSEGLVGGVGIMGMILFIASAFSFFRLKEGPSVAGVSDI